MKVVHYKEEYRDDMHNICIHTGSPDNLVNPQHHDFSLLMYCDPYLDHGKNFVLLDDEDKPVGYILCAPNYEEFKEYMPNYFQKIQEVAPSFMYRCDISEYEPYKDIYPAHLHIDILENTTGKGNGTLLMNTLLTSLKEDGVKGIMVGVAKDNIRAFNFYQKMGFQVLEENEGGYTLGQSLMEINY